MRLVRLTPEAFDSLANRTWVISKNLHLAKAVLVDGKSNSEVADEYGESKQLVSKIVNYIRREFDELQPNGALVEIDQPVPAMLAREIEKLLELLKEDPASDRAIAASNGLKKLRKQVAGIN